MQGRRKGRDVAVRHSITVISGKKKRKDVVVTLPGGNIAFSDHPEDGSAAMTLVKRRRKGGSVTFNAPGAENSINWGRKGGVATVGKLLPTSSLAKSLGLGRSNCRRKLHAKGKVSMTTDEWFYTGISAASVQKCQDNCMMRVGYLVNPETKLSKSNQRTEGDEE